MVIVGYSTPEGTHTVCIIVVMVEVIEQCNKKYPDTKNEI